MAGSPELLDRAEAPELLELREAPEREAAASPETRAQRVLRVLEWPAPEPGVAQAPPPVEPAEVWVALAQLARPVELRVGVAWAAPRQAWAEADLAPAVAHRALAEPVARPRRAARARVTIAAAAAARPDRIRHPSVRFR